MTRAKDKEIDSTDTSVSITPKMNEADFKKFSHLIKGEFGIKMPILKKQCLKPDCRKGFVHWVFVIILSIVIICSAQVALNVN